MKTPPEEISARSSSHISSHMSSQWNDGWYRFARCQPSPNFGPRPAEARGREEGVREVRVPSHGESFDL